MATTTRKPNALDALDMLIGIGVKNRFTSDRELARRKVLAAELQHEIDAPLIGEPGAGMNTAPGPSQGRRGPEKGWQDRAGTRALPRLRVGGIFSNRHYGEVKHE